jgi:flagellar basal body-associated protein FliL
MDPIVTTPTRTNNKSKIIILVLSLIIVIAGAIAGWVLVRQNQQISEKASVSTGTAKTYISPSTKTVAVGDTFTANLLVNTAGQYISVLTLDLSYSYSGSTPPIEATDVQINSSLLTDESWKFPVKTINDSDGTVQIKIQGLSSSQQGYQTDGEESVATITFKAQEAGVINVNFNSTTTKAMSKTTGLDILLIPDSSGTFTATGETATPTATATSESDDEDNDATVTPTSTSTSKSWTSPTPTAVPVPQSGVSLPTTIGIGLGGILLVGSLFLAL